MEPTTDSSDLEERIERLDAILEWLGTHPDPEVREATAELAAGVRWLHAVGVERLFELVAEDPQRFRRALDDPLVANLLMLYDLVTVDERSRAAAAIECAVEDGVHLADEIGVAAIEDGIVSLRLERTDVDVENIDLLESELERRLARSVPGFRGVRIAAGSTRRSSMTQREDRGEPVSVVSDERRQRIEQRITSIEEDRRARPPDQRSATSGGLVTLGTATPRLAVCRLEEISQGSLHGSLVEDYAVLVVRLESQISTFRNTCPGSILPLHLGRLEDGVIVCPWHGCRFDAATGAAVDDAERSLQRLEHTVEEGTLFVKPR